MTQWSASDLTLYTVFFYSYNIFLFRLVVYPEAFFLRKCNVFRFNNVSASISNFLIPLSRHWFAVFLSTFCFNESVGRTILLRQVSYSSELRFKQIIFQLIHASSSNPPQGHIYDIIYVRYELSSYNLGLI